MTGARTAQRALSGADTFGVVAGVVAWLCRPGSASTLAATRVAAAVGLLWALHVHPGNYDGYARLPSELRRPPSLGGQWLAHLPMTPGWVVPAIVTLTAAAVALLVGWHTRVASVLAAVLGVYVIGLPPQFGNVEHQHHLVWVLVLLAVSPCGDAWSLDARGRTAPAPATVYGFPLRVAWVLIGLAYLSAGIGKYAHGGWSWAVGDNLRNHMWATWYVLDYLPAIRLDQIPGVPQAMGVGTLAFELLFLPAILWRRTRWIAAVAGVLFHLAAGFGLGIWFESLMLLYVMFRDAEPGGQPSQPLRTQVVVGFSLVVAMAAATATLETQGWPVAAYPIFGDRGVEEVVYELVDDGEPLDGADVGMTDYQWHFVVGRLGSEPHLTSDVASELGVPDAELHRVVVWTDPDDTYEMSREVMASGTPT